jgi:hypothetical protein
MHIMTVIINAQYGRFVPALRFPENDDKALDIPKYSTNDKIMRDNCRESATTVTLLTDWYFYNF